jgi:predicted dehydrogenase
MDILYWLAGEECERLSSFGSLMHFKKENAPVGAPERCLEGCPVENECPHNAYRHYLAKNAYWIKDMISFDGSYEAREKALREGPYGRCVYKCDNNVVDHQVVNLEFRSGVTAVFTMSISANWGRTIKLIGTKGEIGGNMEKNEIEITDYLTESKDKIRLKDSIYGHGGGDYGIMRDFIRLVQKDGAEKGLTAAEKSVHSHILAFSAEKARLENKVVAIDKYVKEIKGEGK